VTQVAPTLIQYALAEMFVAHHIGDAQVFQSDKIVVSGVGVRHLVKQVLALVFDVFVQTLDSQ
jgi:hypothetical protein